MSVEERVTREDIAQFLNACFACTGQRELYSTSDDQRVSLAFLHEYVMGNYRRLYARSLAAGVNDFNRAEIVRNLLATGRETPPEFRAEESALLTAAVRALPPQRAWRLAERLRDDRVNNRRTRALLRDLVATQRDIGFQAVKYRRKVRAAAIHAHLRLSGELSGFLFHPMGRSPFRTPLFDAFRRAHYSQEAVYELPFTVAEGLAAKHGIPRATFLERITPRMTERERLRLQGASGGRVAFRPEAAGPTRLASYVLSLPLAERAARRDELEGWLARSVAEASARRGALPLPQGKVAAVLDCSASAAGSDEKRNRPLAIVFAGHRLLRASGAEYRGFWTCPPPDDLLVEARGQTNLSERLLDALDWGARTVVVISDGVENDPPGVFGATLAAAQRLLGELTVVHLNPVFDAEMLSVRSVADDVPAVGLRDAEDLPTALGFARFAAGQSTLAELEAWLADRVTALGVAREEGR